MLFGLMWLKNNMNFPLPVAAIHFISMFLALVVNILLLFRTPGYCRKFVPVLLSFLFPGAGQMAAKKRLRGIIFFSSAFIGFILYYMYLGTEMPDLLIAFGIYGSIIESIWAHQPARNSRLRYKSLSSRYSVDLFDRKRDPILDDLEEQMLRQNQENIDRHLQDFHEHVRQENENYQQTVDHNNDIFREQSDYAMEQHNDFADTSMNDFNNHQW